MCDGIDKLQEISQILYIPTLSFLDYYAPINFNMFVECGI